MLVALIVAAAALGPVAAGAQEATGAHFTTGALELSVAGQLKVLFSTTSAADAAEPIRSEVHSARLEIGARVNEWMSAKIAPDFSLSGVKLKSAYVALQVTPGTELQAGFQRKPFGIRKSAKTRPFIVRGASIRGLDETPYEHWNLIDKLGYADRDVGFQLNGTPAGAPLGFTYALGVYNGPALGASNGHATVQLSGRVTVEPLPLLRAGLGVSRRDFAPPAGDSAGPLRGGIAWTADLEYGRYAPGAHLGVEYAAGAADPFSGTEFRSASLWAAYRTAALRPDVPLHLEPVARLNYGRLGATDAGGLLFTPALNLYVGPLNRVMIDYDFWHPRSGASERSLKVELQLAF